MKDGAPESCREALPFMLGYAGPRTLLLVFGGGVLWKAVEGSWSAGDLVILWAVIGTRSLVEWGLHKYIFGADPLPLVGWRIVNPISRMHGEHHQRPRDFSALFFGWRGILLVMSAWFLLFVAVLGNVNQAVTGVLGVAINLLAYEWCHLLAHSPIDLKPGRFRTVVMNHRKHHFVDGSRWLGVTSTFADRVFGTYD